VHGPNINKILAYPFIHRVRHRVRRRERRIQKRLRRVYWRICLANSSMSTVLYSTVATESSRTSLSRDQKSSNRGGILTHTAQHSARSISDEINGEMSFFFLHYNELVQRLWIPRDRWTRAMNNKQVHFQVLVR
jgi:hypothetical protein